jgi:DNA-binding response OmpR family regulator
MVYQRRVLIVEDEPIIAEVCKKVLAADGFEVDVAGNGRTGRLRLDERRYDVVIIDLRMPVVDGRQLLEYLRESHPEILERVVMTSGELISEDATTFIAGCGRPFLRKPFSPRELRAVVQQVLR